MSAAEWRFANVSRNVALPTSDSAGASAAVARRTRAGRALAMASESELCEPGMIVRAPARGPVEQPLVRADRQVVDARMPLPHQPLLTEFPVLVAVGTEPLVRVVVPFV